MSSIDKKAFGISDSLINAVNEALKGGQVKLDKNHNGKIDGQDFKMLRKEELKGGQKNLDKNHNGKLDSQDFKMLRKEETVAEGNPMNKEKKNAAVAAVGAKNKDSQYLSRMNPAVADKIRGREKMSGKDRQQFEEVQVDEAGMPASVIKSKQNRANMTDKQFADSHKNHSDADLRSMAWRHGHGKPGTSGHDHYVNRRAKGLKEEAEQIDEISTKLAVNYAKGALKSMDTAAAKGSAGHDTFMKRSAGQKLALDKTNPEHKRLKAKVGTTDANAKDAAYKKTVGEDVEQVDEISHTTAWSYSSKRTDKMRQGLKPGEKKELSDIDKTNIKNSANRIDSDYYKKNNFKKVTKEDTQIDELSTDTYHSAAHKAAKRAMGDAQGRSGPIFKKYAGMANKFRDKGMSQEKKEKAMKEETDPGFVSEAENAVAKQIAAKKDTFKKQLQQKIAAKQMNTMQAKANKRLSNIHASNDKCTCQEGKGKSMTCEMHGEKDKAMKGGKEQIIVNPPMREAAELPKKVITKGHEIAKSLIKHRAGVDNPYAVGMAQAKKSAKMNVYRADRNKHGED